MSHKPLKYGNKITVVHGIKFRSKGEANRYCELLLLEKAGKIFNLRTQVRHRLIVDGWDLKQWYISDFEYEEDGIHVIEDYKGAKTLLFKLKWELMNMILAGTKGHYELRLTGPASNRKLSSPRRTSASRSVRK